MIKKTFLLFASIICIQFNIYSQGIHIYTGSMADAKALALKENKYLIIDGYTDWCGWCKFMDKNIYPLKEVGDFYNEHFIFVQMNMEKGEGKDVARQYRLQMYPSFLFFDPQGSFVHYNFGASTSAESFIKVGRTAMDSLHNCRGLAYRFFRGEKDTAFLKEMINTISYYADSKITEKALAAYWEGIPENQLLEKGNWDMFKYYEADINSRAYNYFMAHQSECQERYRTKEDSNMLFLKAAFYIKTAVDSHDETMLNKARNIALKSHDKQTRYSLCFNELPYYLKMNKPAVLYNDVDHYIQMFGNDWLWGITSEIENRTDNKKILEKALEYQSQALKTNNTFHNTETYARILYKLGRVKEAYASANDALVQAQNIGEQEEKNRDIIEANELLDRIKKAAGQNK